MKRSHRVDGEEIRTDLIAAGVLTPGSDQITPFVAVAAVRLTDADRIQAALAIAGGPSNIVREILEDPSTDPIVRRALPRALERVHAQRGRRASRGAER